MRFLVTGGAGFIGSNYVRHLLATDPDARVTNFDKLTDAGNRASVDDLEGDPATGSSRATSATPTRSPRPSPATTW